MAAVAMVVLAGCGGSGGRVTTARVTAPTATPAVGLASRASTPVKPARLAAPRPKPRGQRLYERVCAVPEYGGPCAEGPLAFER